MEITAGLTAAPGAGFELRSLQLDSPRADQVLVSADLDRAVAAMRSHEIIKPVLTL